MDAICYGYFLMSQRKIKEQEEKKHNNVENSSNTSISGSFIHSHSDVTLQNTHFNTFMNPTFNPTLSNH